MNCRDFNEKLYECLDEALEAHARSAAQEHLQQCGDCRRLYRREVTLAKSIRWSLERATAGLSLRPETQRNILKALKSHPAPSKTWLDALRKFFGCSSVWPISAGAAFVSLLLLFAAIQFRQRGEERSTSQTVSGQARAACVIDVPIQTQTHVFRLANDKVVDTIVSSASAERAYFLEKNK